MRSIGIICSLCAILFTACGQNQKLKANNIENITIQILSNDSKSVNDVTLAREDINKITEILVGSEIHTDKGFVFAEGMYRIVLESENEDVVLYPYCGSGGTLRIGESGSKYVKLEQDEIDEIKEIINDYAVVKGGIYEWDSITGSTE